MKSIQIQLTTKCEQRCFMCRKYTWESREMSVDVLREKIYKYKACTFTFSGGDPLSYTHLKELNQILYETGSSYQVFTNLGYELTEDMWEFLECAQVVQVSMDGCTSETYNAVRNPIDTRATYTRAWANLYFLQLMNTCRVKVNCTITNRNYKEVAELYRIFVNDGIIFRAFFAHTNENAMVNKEQFASLMADLAKYLFSKEGMMQGVQILNYTNLASIYKTRWEDLQGKEYKGPCYVKCEHRVIDEWGTEYPCCRAINDNGCDWGEKNSVENLSGIDNPQITYDFCKGCDRYVKFNQDWGKYKDKENLYL